MAVQHDDDVVSKSIDFTLLKRLLQFLQPYRTPVIGAIALTMLASAMGPLRPYLMRIAIDDKITHKDWHGLLMIIGSIVGLMLMQGAFNYSLAMLMQWIGQSAILDLRIKLYERLQILSLRFYDTTPIGRLVTRVTSDVEVLNEVLSSGIVMIITDIFVISWIMFFMFATNWQLAVLTIGIVPILLIATNIFRKAVRKQYREIRKQIARLNSFLNEYISGINIVQLFSQEKQQFAQFHDINTAHTNAQIRSVFYYASFFPVVEMLSTIAVCLGLWYAAENILQGTMSIGVLIAFSQYMEQFFRPIRDLSEKYNTLQSAMVSSERIFVLLDQDSFVRDNVNAQPLPSFEKEIEFRDVHFAYDGEHPVLKGISFTVKKGQTVAIVGATGAGKSSLMNLLTRFYEFQRGDILIDGKSIRDIEQRSLRKHIAIVLQDVFLFSRSIKENISLGDESITDEQVKAGAHAVGAGDFIERLPERYETQVMERGATLSVGQKQLISFARALVRNPDILILDEATANIDTATETLIEAAVAKLLHGRTSIVIAHRLSTIQRADNIIVLHHGHLREMGTHQELLANNGLYAKLYRLQYKEQLATA